MCVVVKTMLKRDRWKLELPVPGVPKVDLGNSETLCAVLKPNLFGHEMRSFGFRLCWVRGKFRVMKKNVLIDREGQQ